jgi:nucleotide-binding universal stress UspA family protein
MKLRRILVALDFLNARDAAFERALALARTYGAELYLLHAVPLHRRSSFGAAERLARKEEMVKRAEDTGVRVRTAEQHGDPAEIIELHANSRAVDLIVIGGEAGRGRRRDRSFVAERVIRRTRVPALVVASDRGDAASTFRHVLVAVDLSPASKDVLQGAIALTAHEAERLTVVHAVQGIEAVEALRMPAWKLPEYRTLVTQGARRQLERVVSDVAGNVATAVQVTTGPTARAVLEYAADLDVDLVVVGRSRGFKLFGSTALRVFRKNDRALLVIPSAADHRATRIEEQRAA